MTVGEPFRVVVLGAGITGLALSWYLERRFGARIKITLIDKSKRPGGWLRSQEKEGFMFEAGPRSLRAKGNGFYTLSLIDELGLESELIVADPSSRIRYLWMGGELQKLPGGFFGFFTSPMTRGLIPALFKERYVPASGECDESIHAFFSRRMGQQVADVFVDAMVSGIYAGDAKALSMRACFPKVWSLEQEYGSVVRGMMQLGKERRQSMRPWMRKVRRGGIYSFRRGVETLAKALHENISSQMLLGCPVEKITRQGRGFSVLAGGKQYGADAVFSTIGAKQLSPVIFHMDPEAAKSLNSQTSASVAVVGIGFHKLSGQPKGFGHLIPSSENAPNLGVVWDSSVFPQQNLEKNQVRYSVMLGGARHPEVVDKSDQELESLALKAMGMQLGIYKTPDVMEVFCARDAIAQYEVGHCLWVDSLVSRMEGLHLGGSSFHGVSVNDCIAWAFETVENFQLPH